MTMKLTKEAFGELMRNRYKAIGELLFGERRDDEYDDPRDQFMSILASTAALITALGGTISALRKSGMVPADLGEGLAERVATLEKDIQKAVVAKLILDSTSAKASDERVVH